MASVPVTPLGNTQRYNPSVAGVAIVFANPAKAPPSAAISAKGILTRGEAWYVSFISASACSACRPGLKLLLASASSFMTSKSFLAICFTSVTIPGNADRFDAAVRIFPLHTDGVYAELAADQLFHGQILHISWVSWFGAWPLEDTVLKEVSSNFRDKQIIRTSS